MPVRTIAVLLLSIGLSSPIAFAQERPPATRPPRQTKLPRPKVSAPLEFWGGRPAVLATINGKGPYRLDVDTGAPMAALIDHAVLREIGLPVPEKVDQLCAADHARPIRVDSLKIGDAEFVGVPAIPVDFEGFMPRGAGAPVGVLGLALFENCLLTFDYPARQLILETGELSPPGGDVLAYSPDREKDFGLTIEARFAGTPVRMHIDTGSPARLTLLSKWADKLPLLDKPRVVGLAATPTSKSEVKAATLNGRVQIGSHEFENPTVEFADLGPMVDFDCGNIGSGLLRDFAMTVDQQRRRVRLRAANGVTTRPAQRDSDQPCRVGVAFHPTGNTMIVDMLVPGGAGEKAGLQVGDVLVALNGKPLSELDQAQISKVFGSPQPAELEVQRGDKTIHLTVTPERVSGTP